MDPASLALGVVSLAMQLVQTTEAIKNLISAYKSAAKELETLSNKLDDVETICYSLEVVLANVESPTHKPWEVNLLKRLHRIILECCEKTSDIHNIINKISSKHKKGCNPLRTLGSLFLHYRNDIRICTEGLDRSLSSLQLHMTANIFTMSMSPSQVTSQPRTVLAPSLNTGKPQYETNVQSRDELHPVKRETEVVVETWRQEWQSMALFQKTRKRMTHRNMASPVFQDDSTVTFGSPILNLYITFSMRRGSFSPLSFALQVPRVICINESPNDAGGRVSRAFEIDDLEAIYGLFKEGVLTPVTTVVWDEYDPDDEMTLLGLSVTWNSSRIFRFLVHQIFDVYQKNHIASTANIYQSVSSSGQLSPVLDYINLRRELITPTELRKALPAIDDPNYFRLCIETCKRNFPNGWEPFNNMIWAFVVSKFSDYEDDHLEGWAPIVADTIARGVDIHRQIDPDDGLSAFTHILRLQLHTDAAIEKMNRWIDLLEVAGVDKERYLEIETERCFAGWNESPSWFDDTPSHYRRVLYIEQSNGRRFPCWVKLVDESCPLRDLLTEFPRFMNRETLVDREGPIGTMIQYKAWKNGTPLDSPVMAGAWPVWVPLQRTPPTWDIIPENMEQRRIAVEWVDHACSLMESRFERKQMRKRRKAGYQRGLRKEKPMPGAWMDGW